VKQNFIYEYKNLFFYIALIFSSKKIYESSFEVWDDCCEPFPPEKHPRLGVIRSLSGYDGKEKKPSPTGNRIPVV
jgi:hypothetical protein